LLGFVAAIVALVGAWLISAPVGVTVTAGLALNAAYSLPPLRLCARGALAVALLPLGYVALPYLVGALTAQPRIGWHALALLAGLYVTFIGRIVLKDFRDVAGDAQFDKRTFLLRHGRTRTCALSAVCWVGGSAMLLTLVPVWSVLTLVFVAYVAAALHGLRALAQPQSNGAEQVVIGAIAQLGRGMGITLLAHLTMTTKQWSADQQSVVYVALGFLFLGMYRAMFAERETVTTLAIRPY
jgi:4-hydroxybenzoate polyprenyltransferase